MARLLTHLLTMFALALALSVSGCVSPAPPNVVAPANFPSPDGAPVARELDKITLPTYTIEPPDVLTIETQRIVPRSPYRLRPLDALQISVQGTLPDQPINGIFIVEPSGMVSLGPGYNKAMVGGLPLEEAEEIIESQLRRTLREPEVSLTLAEAAGLQQIFGQHQVGPDGTINLGIYGTVLVTGLTIDQASEAINKQLEVLLENPRVSVDVYTYSSKKYYVIIAGAGTGDSINSFPCTGSDTVLDAISLVQSTGSNFNRKMWIARPAPGGVGCDQILPVDYDAIVRGGSASTNYQIFPGDRIYFEDSRILAFSNRMNRVLDPIQRVFGFALLGANAIQTSNRYPNGNN